MYLSLQSLRMLITDVLTDVFVQVMYLSLQNLRMVHTLGADDSCWEVPSTFNPPQPYILNPAPSTFNPSVQ